MNLLLVDSNELNERSEVTLHGDRAKHLRRILKVREGDKIRVGIVDGLVGTGTVIRQEDFSVTLFCDCTSSPPEKGQDTLLLAFARPKVLLRCLEHATALGFGQIILFRSKRVEKSHLSSSAMKPEIMDHHIRHGLVQARRTLRPKISFLANFKDLLGPELDTLIGPENRFLADPNATEEAAHASIQSAPLTLTIGPEGGFIPAELQELSANRFQLVKAGNQPLRVETALSYLCGQLRAVRSIASLHQ